jgi:hypothetical protein
MSASTVESSPENDFLNEALLAGLHTSRNYGPLPKLGHDFRCGIVSNRMGNAVNFPDGGLPLLSPGHPSVTDMANIRARDEFCWRPIQHL